MCVKLWTKLQIPIMSQHLNQASKNAVNTDRKTLIIRLSSIGDVILATAALSALPPDD